MVLQIAGLSVTVPIRGEIDGACRSAESAAPRAAAKITYSGQKSAPRWQPASPQSEEQAQRDPRFLEGQFAWIRTRGNALAAALTQFDISGDGSISYEYCYRSSRLVRVRTTVASATDEIIWTRTVYYDGASPIAVTSTSRDLAKHRAHPVTPPKLQTPLYRTPSALPFWKVL